MFGRLMPREGRFFDLFNAHADRIVQGSRELAALMAQPQQVDVHAAAIDAIEKEADGITHETVTLLHRTFITPLDREDIHILISRMDDILDLAQDAAESLALYDIRKVTAEARQLADICVMCGERVKAAVALLPNPDNGPTVLKICREIAQLESDADRVMRGAMSRLFRSNTDALEVIKLKEIYQLLEAITDRCDDVANILEGIVLEHS